VVLHDEAGRPGVSRARSASMVARVLVAGVACGLLVACLGSPTEPRETPLANGRWIGSGACLSVADAGCNLAVGCGHGQFPRPTIRSDGTFDVDGTYRIEVGPISIDPPPPAHFSGSLVAGALTLKVAPALGSLPPASYSMTPGPPGTCPIPCV
jgi:hypothetical protein